MPAREPVLRSGAGTLTFGAGTLTPYSQARTWPTRKAIIPTRARQNRTRAARISKVMSRIFHKDDDTATGCGGCQPPPHRVAVAG